MIVRPRTITERLFLHGVRAIPVQPSMVERNSHAILSCRWDSSCQDIGALWASIMPREVVLSTKISHRHFSHTDYLKKTMGNLVVKRQLVRDSLLEVARFLRGEVAVSATYKNGRLHSSGWCKLTQLSSAEARTQELFGAGLVQKAWNWSGEISAESR